MNALSFLLNSRSKRIVSGFVFGLFCFGLVACGGDESAQVQAPPPAVSVYPVVAKPVGDYSEFVARTEAFAEAELVARLEGEITEINFKEGGLVSKGDLLIKIDASEYKASAEQFKADLQAQQAAVASAQRDLERGSKVAEKGYLSQADLDKLKDRLEQSQAALKAAEAALEKQEVNLTYTQITAPFDGRIGKVNYDVGNVVGPASGALAVVSAIDPIYVNFNVNEADFITYQQRRQQSGEQTRFDLHVRLPNNEIYKEQGRVDFADVRSDPGTGTVAVRAVFPNPEGIVVPGLYVTLIAESQEKETQVIVPQMAVQENLEGKFVLVVDDNDQVLQRLVKLGRRIGPMWVVAEGLAEGERVIVEGLQKVKAGIKVQPVEKTMDENTGALGPVKGS